VYVVRGPGPAKRAAYARAFRGTRPTKLRWRYAFVEKTHFAAASVAVFRGAPKARSLPLMLTGARPQRTAESRAHGADVASGLLLLIATARMRADPGSVCL